MNLDVRAQKISEVFLLLNFTGFLKIFIRIMVSLRFHDEHEKSDFLELETNLEEEVTCIYFTFLNSKGEITNANICLNRETAIKFSKELRKQIALIPH